MNLFSFGTIRSMRFLWGRVATQMQDTLVDCYLRRVGTLPKPRTMSHAFETVLVCCFGIGPVLRTRRLTQILESIIAAETIAMIELLAGPTSAHVKPSQSVLSIGDLLKFDVAIPSMMQVSRPFAYADFGPRYSPTENPSDEVVMEKFQQPSMRYWHVRYFALPRQRLQVINAASC